MAACALGGTTEIQAQRRRRRRLGCMLSEDDAQSFLNTSSQQQLYASGHESVVMSSGDKTFDTALAMTLSRISDAFDVLPGFAYYDDYDGANAFATTVVRLKNADGTVLFGTRYLKRLLGLRENPDVAVAAVCAHDWAHFAVQAGLGPSGE
jgi:hypothetical protein